MDYYGGDIMRFEVGHTCDPCGQDRATVEWPDGRRVCYDCTFWLVEEPAPPQEWESVKG